MTVESEEEKVKVVVRMRKLIAREKTAREKIKWEVNEDFCSIKEIKSASNNRSQPNSLDKNNTLIRNRKSTLSVSSSVHKNKNSRRFTSMAPGANNNSDSNSNSSTPQEFNFDNCYGTTADNQKIYNESCEKIVDRFCTGYNGTIMCYGQTASGKTYTMSGDENNGATMGINHFVVQQIQKYIKNSPNKEFCVLMSYIEIYNENFKDLLSDETQDYRLITDPVLKTTSVTNITEDVITNFDQIFTNIKQGNERRHVGVTNMNERSSRSHTVLRLVLESQIKNSEETKRANLYLVDLAGSEKVSDTGAYGQQLREAANINRSLSTLTKVIGQICDGQKHISYRDSKLTHLLQSALGGNSSCVFIVCISPANSNFQQSLNSLRLANSAKKISCKVSCNADMSDQAMIKQLRLQAKDSKNKLEEQENQIKEMRILLAQAEKVKENLDVFRSGIINISNEKRPRARNNRSLRRKTLSIQVGGGTSDSDIGNQSLFVFEPLDPIPQVPTRNARNLSGENFDKNLSIGNLNHSKNSLDSSTSTIAAAPPRSQNLMNCTHNSSMGLISEENQKVFELEEKNEDLMDQLKEREEKILELQKKLEDQESKVFEPVFDSASDEMIVRTQQTQQNATQTTQKENEYQKLCDKLNDRLSDLQKEVLDKEIVIEKLQGEIRTIQDDRDEKSYFKNELKFDADFENEEKMIELQQEVENLKLKSLASEKQLAEINDTKDSKVSSLEYENEILTQQNKKLKDRVERLMNSHDDFQNGENSAKRVKISDSTENLALIASLEASSKEYQLQIQNLAIELESSKNNCHKLANFVNQQIASANNLQAKHVLESKNFSSQIMKLKLEHQKEMNIVRFQLNTAQEAYNKLLANPIKIKIQKEEDQKLEAENIELNEKIIELQFDNKKFESDLLEQANLITELKSGMVDLQKILAETEREKEELTMRNCDATEEFTSLKDSNSILNQDKLNLTEKNNELLREIEQSQFEIAKLTTSLDKYKSELGDHEELIGSVQMDLKMAKREKIETEENFLKLQESHAEMVSDYSIDLTNKTKECTNLQNQINQLLDQQEKTKTKFQEKWDVNLQNQKAEILELTKKCADFEDLAAEKTKLAEAFESLKVEKSDLKAELSEVKILVSDKDSKIIEQFSEIQELKESMDKCKNDLSNELNTKTDEINQLNEIISSQGLNAQELESKSLEKLQQLKEELSSKKQEILDLKSTLSSKNTEINAFHSQIIPTHNKTIEEMNSKIENLQQDLDKESENFNSMSMDYENKLSKAEMKLRDFEQIKKEYENSVKNLENAEDDLRKARDSLQSLELKQNTLKLDECCQVNFDDPEVKNLSSELEQFRIISKDQQKKISHLLEDIEILKADLESKDQSSIEFNHEKRAMKVKFDRQILEMQEELDQQLSDKDAKYKERIDNLVKDRDEISNKVRNEMVTKLEFEKISQKLKEAEELLEEKSEIFDKLEAKNKEIDQEKIVAKQEKEEIERTFNSLEAKISTLEKKILKKDEQISEYLEMVNSNEIVIRELQQTNKNLKNQSNNSALDKAKIEDLEAKNRQLNEEIFNLKIDNSKKDARCQDFDLIQDQLQSQISDMNRKLSDKNDSNQDKQELEDKIDEMTDKITKLESENKEISKKVNTLESEKQTFEDKLQNLQSKHDKQNKKLQTVEEKLERRNNRVEELTQKIMVNNDKYKEYCEKFKSRSLDWQKERDAERVKVTNLTKELSDLKEKHEDQRKKLKEYYQKVHGKIPTMEEITENWKMQKLKKAEIRLTRSEKIDEANAKLSGIVTNENKNEEHSQNSQNHKNLKNSEPQGILIDTPRKKEIARGNLLTEKEKAEKIAAANAKLLSQGSSQIATQDLAEMELEDFSGRISPEDKENVVPSQDDNKVQGRKIMTRTRSQENFEKRTRNTRSQSRR